MFAYPCPSCGQRLTALPERAGQRTICPKCLRPATIPSPEQVPARGSDVVPLPADEDPAHALFDPPAPPPRPPAASRRPAANGVVVLSPAGSVDLASELSAALSARMNPPPEPPSDLRISTGAWLLLSAAAGLLWLVGVTYEPELLPFVAVIGALEASFGYLWAAYLAGRRDWVRGVVTLIPPVTVWRLFRPFGDQGFRPLRFVATGLLLLALYAIGPVVRAAILPVFTVFEPVRVDPPAPPPSPAERLRTAAGQKHPDALLGELAELTRPEAVRAAPEQDRKETAAELKRLVGDDRPEVRAAALAALAAWDPDAARGPALAALRSADAAERKRALTLAARWPDDEVAKAVADRLTDRQEGHAAQTALLEIGGRPAEGAVLPLLKSEDSSVRMMAMDLLEKVGGRRTVDALTELGKSDPNDGVRDEAKAKAKALAAKLGAGSK